MTPGLTVSACCKRSSHPCKQRRGRKTREATRKPKKEVQKADKDYRNKQADAIKKLKEEWKLPPGEKSSLFPCDEEKQICSVKIIPSALEDAVKRCYSGASGGLFGKKQGPCLPDLEDLHG